MALDHTALAAVCQSIDQGVVSSLGCSEPDCVSHCLPELDYRWQQATAAELRFYVLINYGQLQEFKQALAQHGCEVFVWPVEQQVLYAKLALACGLGAQYPALEQLEL